MDRLTAHRGALVKELSRMALRYNVNIVGGSHPTRTDDGDIQNVAYVCLRDGSVHEQEKIHPTPNEAYWWKIKGRSEEHTSELQSLMRISYAVFCLKKKKEQTKRKTNTHYK